MTGDFTVFIVDDDEAVRDSLKSLLEVSGYAVETFATATQFLDLHDPRRTACLLLDVRLPDVSGLEVQERLAARGASLPVVIITGHGDVPKAVKAMKAGAIDFIEKPFSETLILEAIRRAAAQVERREDQAAAAWDAKGKIASLTPRQRDVLKRLVGGQSNKVIAHQLSVSPRTVEIHRARIMQKLRVRSLAEVVRIALAAGIEPNAR